MSLSTDQTARPGESATADAGAPNLLDAVFEDGWVCSEAVYGHPPRLCPLGNRGDHPTGSGRADRAAADGYDATAAAADDDGAFVSYDEQLEIQAALALVVVGRRVFQPGKQRSGYVLFAVEAAGNELNVGKHNISQRHSASYLVVFPPSTDRTHVQLRRPRCIAPGVWDHIFQDIEPCTRFHQAVPIAEHQLRPRCAPRDCAARHPALAALLDLRAATVLLEYGDSEHAHPIYLGRTFIDSAPVDEQMRGYDVEQLPSLGLCNWVLERAALELTQNSDDEDADDMFRYASSDSEDDDLWEFSTAGEGPGVQDPDADESNSGAHKAAPQRRVPPSSKAAARPRGPQASAAAPSSGGSKASKAKQAEAAPKPPSAPAPRLTAAKLAAAREKLAQANNVKEQST